MAEPIRPPTPAPGADPRHEYGRRLAQRQSAVAELDRRSTRLSTGRLVLFVMAVAGVGAGLSVDAMSPWWALPPALAFVAAVAVHDRVIRARARAALAVAHYEQGLRRIDDAWEGDGVQTHDYVADDHPYASDLDVFGPGSLFELLCRARTRAGEERLASWLAHGAEAEVVRRRQRAVAELRDAVDLREDLALLGGDVRVGIRPRVLVEWGEAPPVLSGGRAVVLRLLAWALPSLVLATSLVWALTDVGALPFVVALGLVWVGGRPFREEIGRATFSAEEPGREMAVLAHLFRRLERERFVDPGLARLRDEVAGAGSGAADHIRRLHRLVGWLEAQRNQVFAPVGFMLMWTAHFSLAIEAWRARSGARIHAWLDALAELEALSSLAAHAYEHPRDPLPEILDEGPAFVGERLGHPLLADDRFVRNSVALGGALRVMVVSGSNMSGKSTLLRTVGVNAVMAMAGGVVRAEQLRLSPLAVGATLRVQDSLREGSSRFYAEVNRLRQLSDMAARRPPLLFLLDEIFHGTNSHDRLIGAEAVIRSLVAAGAVGLVTTHDLALAKAADALGQKAINVHFSDEIVDGKLHFDYRMHPGVVHRSNALELMRSVGLEV